MRRRGFPRLQIIFGTRLARSLGENGWYRRCHCFWDSGAMLHSVRYPSTSEPLDFESPSHVRNFFSALEYGFRGY